MIVQSLHLLSDGRALRCTEAHQWAIWEGFSRDGIERRVPAGSLEPGAKLIKHSYPVIEGGVDFDHAYTQGFISAEGMDDYNYFYVYPPKASVLDRLSAVDTRPPDSSGRIRVSIGFDKLQKTFVPFRWSVKSRLDWLAGLLDGDGTELKEGGAQLSSVDRNFLLEVQKLLTTLGVFSKLLIMHESGTRQMPNGRGGYAPFECQDCWRLCIGSVQIQSLKDLGMKCERLRFEKTPNRDASRFVTVTAVIRDGVEPIVYCFTEKKRNLGCFEGIVTGQCAEATLDDKEPCNLQEIALPNLSGEDEFIEAARLMHRWGKRVTLEKYHITEVQDIIDKNRRVGTGITGCLQSSLFDAKVLDKAYAAIQDENLSYSKQLGIPESIRTTVVKPSGTVGKMFDCLPGIHPAFSQYMIQRIRFSANDPIIPILRAAGHYIEPVQRFDGTLDHNTLVVDFYIAWPDGVPTAETTTTWQQLDVLLKAQRHWADQAVSVTVYYKKEEIPALKTWIAENLKNIKTISFLCFNDHGFAQAPMEAISKEQYEKFSGKIKSIDFESISAGDLENFECQSGACPIK